MLLYKLLSRPNIKFGGGGATFLLYFGLSRTSCSGKTTFVAELSSRLNIKVLGKTTFICILLS